MDKFQAFGKNIRWVSAVHCCLCLYIGGTWDDGGLSVLDSFAVDGEQYHGG